MENMILSPPFAFLILLVVFIFLSYITKYMAPKGTTTAGKGEAYAGGENVRSHRAQPDYRQFFPFAFFFTIMHVVVLIVATVPKEASMLSFIYISAALLALLILFRK